MSLMELKTLTSLLKYRAEQSAGETAFLFNQVAVSYDQLWQKTRLAAGQFHAAGIKPGDRVILMFPNGGEFFYAFYGVQVLRAIPVPIAPAAGIERVISIAQLAGAKHVIVSSLTPDALIEKHRAKTEQAGLQVHKVNFSVAAAPVMEFETVQEDDIAFIQFTSGSTGTPKGVPLTHKKLLTNVRQMSAGMEITKE